MLGMGTHTSFDSAGLAMSWYGFSAHGFVMMAVLNNSHCETDTIFKLKDAIYSQD